MKNVFKILFFLFYLILIFYINSFLVLIYLLFIKLILIDIFNLEFNVYLKRIFILIPFIIFTTIINTIFSGYIYGIFIGIRLITAYTITYIFIKNITINQLINAIEKILYPLKIFKIDIEQITLIISIAISILPNMMNEITQKCYSANSKAFKINFFNITFILKPIFISILMKTNEFENALIAKGYNNEIK